MSIEQYRLLMEGRQQVLQVAADYKKATALSFSNPLQAVQWLDKAAKAAGVLKSRYAVLQDRFRAAWLRENQPYSLDIATRPYVTRIRDLQQLQNKLQQAARTLQAQQVAALPGSIAMRLAVVESNHTYFQNWLLCGPFEMNTNHTPPAFLYTGDAGVETPPKPGDLISYRNNSFRWKKYVSLNGGMTELADLYTAAGNQAAYAYCTITTDQSRQVASFTTAGNGIALFCNGVEIPAVPSEQQHQEEESRLLPLKTGINHILLKIPQGTEPWSFSFRLDQGVNVTNQKYKYFINTEKGNHEAE
jgi:hypothetical protein